MLGFHFLVFCGSPQSLCFTYHIWASTICGIIQGTYLVYFPDIWKPSHCVSAIDGKHVGKVSPLNSGSFHFDYKSYFSTVLICDSHYPFTFVDIGSYSSNNDNAYFEIQPWQNISPMKNWIYRSDRSVPHSGNHLILF